MIFLFVGGGGGTEPPYNLKKYNWYETTTSGKPVIRQKK